MHCPEGQCREQESRSDSLFRMRTSVLSPSIAALMERAILRPCRTDNSCRFCDSKLDGLQISPISHSSDSESPNRLPMAPAAPDRRPILLFRQYDTSRRSQDRETSSFWNAVNCTDWYATSGMWPATFKP